MKAGYPEASRWLARVMNTRYMMMRFDEQDALRAAIEKYQTLDDLPDDMLALGKRALEAG